MTSIWIGAKVRLRGIEPDDWEALMRFDEHSADMRSVDAVSPPRSAAGYRQWASDRAARTPDGDEFELAIESLADQCMVGGLSTAHTDRRAGRFRYGIGIIREHQGQGYASDAIRVLLTYMFGERRYHKCEVTIYGFNEASMRLHRAMGFQVEGRLRDHEFFAGRHHDLVIMGLTRTEFVERNPLPAL